MSLHYLLDGYNIIHQIPKLSLEKLEVQRKELVRFIEMHGLKGSINNQLTIVFDGKATVFGSFESGPVKVIFSHGESADEKIKRIVSDAGDKKNIVVVTDDRDIQYAIRALGAKSMAVKEFLSKAKPSLMASNVKKKQLKENKQISNVLESKITSEFERIWLKSKEK